MTLRIVFMGTPDFSVPTLAEIIGAGHEVVAVYSQPPRPAGRGMAERKSPVHAFAEASGCTGAAWPPMSVCTQPGCSTKQVNFENSIERHLFIMLRAAFDMR